ncbi:CD59 glycoprotein-like [Sebastes fasciatus]|uniref:CD59 glycoprotein-like n=1 Tax=Sebastes fasciatus TaxID=394691 RepID=UPI003D9DFB66
MMRSSVVFFLAVSCAMFGFGFSLQCYICPDGSCNGTEFKQECNQGVDSCLKLTSGEKIYTGCIMYEDCDFMTLAQRYPFSQIKYECCQSNLCNGPKKSVFKRLMDFIFNK